MLAALFTQPEGTIMWKKILFVLMSVLSLAVSACNTVSGAGRDVESAGRAVSNEAEEHKRY
jgi:predicted small secreted protein